MNVFRTDTRYRENRRFSIRSTAPLQVAFQGVPGAYSFEAARLHFGARAELCAYPSFAEVCQAVAQGQTTWGVIPVANSQTGRMPEMEQEIARFGLKVCEQVDYPVSHCLLCLPGQTMSDLVMVVSHPQALAQCARFLSGLQVQTRAMANTAVSARTIWEEQLKGFAAIAGASAARYYHLDILKQGIEDTSGNTTRFAVVQRGGMD